MEFNDYYQVAVEVKDCSHKVWEYALSKVSMENFDGQSIIIQVPPSVHGLLELKFNQKYPAEQRNVLWELIYSVLMDTFNRENYESRFNNLLENMFQKTAEGNSFEVDRVDLYDIDGELEWNRSLIEITDFDGNKKFIPEEAFVSSEDEFQHIAIEIQLKTTYFRE